MVGISSSEAMLRFIPGALEWSAEGRRKLSRPVRETHLGALLITDISGFTGLTTKFSSSGDRAGVERISFVLNEFISSLVAEIEKHGGLVLGFEGDSLLAGWKAESESALPEAIWRACYCSQSLHQKSWNSSAEGEMLTLRSGVAAGTIELLHVLQGSQQRRLILAGDSVTEVSECALLAESGEVLVSEKAWKFVRDVGEGVKAAPGAIRLSKVRAPTPGDFPMAVSRGGEIDPAQYIPSFLASRLGSSLSHWLAEIRTITVMFIKLKGPDLLEDLRLLDDRLDRLQSTVSRFGGDLLQLSGSGRGLHGLCAFGLPGHAHKDDARRAALAALELQSLFDKEDIRLSVGLATGEAFCGAIGAPHRADYTVIGDAVNRSSRLSVVSAGRILADGMTARAASDAIDFDGPWPLQVRGARAPVDAFVALRPKRSVPQLRTELVGRDAELARLSTLARQVGKGRKEVLLIVGAPGIGKSALIEAFLGDCHSKGIEVLLAAADDIERETPYFVFRQVIRNLIGLHDPASQDAIGLIEKRLEHRQDLLPLIPLLRDLIDLGPNQASQMDRMKGVVRSDNLRRLLCEIIEDQITSRKCVLVLEDVHWMDSSSKSLLREFLQDSDNVAMVLTTRDAQDIAADLGLDSAELLKLEPLNSDGGKTLMRRLLVAAVVPRELEEFVLDHTSGNPFFIGEICHAINLRQTVDIRTASGLESELITLPQSARSAILSRTDALPPDCQVVLKVASAMGTNFTTEELKSVGMINASAIDVDACIQGLVLQYLIKPVSSMNGRWTFSHAIIRDVVYDSMLAGQHQETHAAIAESIEAAPWHSEAETLPILFNQWQRAGDRRRIAGYLDKLAELRLRQFDNSSAISLIEMMLSMASGQGIDFSPQRLGVAHLILAEARLNLGRTEAAQNAYEQGMRLLGLPLPKGTLAVAWQLTLQLGVQVWRRLTHTRKARLLEKETAKGLLNEDLFLRAARALEDLTRIYYFQNDKFRLLQATLRATNLAERYGKETSVLAVNYASLGAICGVIPMRKQAKAYLQLASALAERLDDPAVDARVNLMTGLYETSVANWWPAKRHLDAGIRQALQLGDSRRWSELAVSLEMISSPWLRSPVFAGAEEWARLVEEICSTGRKRGDLHILGCGLVAGLRGYSALKDPEIAGHYLAEMSALLEDPQAELEQIHVVEASAYLAEAAFSHGDMQVADAHLAKCTVLVEAINPAMKSRTLPALRAFFRVAMRRAQSPGETAGGKAARRSAAVAEAKLRRFARVYPIGRPYAFLCKGELDLCDGRAVKALGSWRNAVAEAARLEMPLVGLEALERLNANSTKLTREDLAAAALLERQMAASSMPAKTKGGSETVYM